MAYTGGATAVAAAAAMAQAIKASGAIVRVEPEAFMLLVDKVTEPLIVTAEGGIFSKHQQYLMGYKGLVFFTKSPDKLPIPLSAELIAAKKIWIPD